MLIFYLRSPKSHGWHLSNGSRSYEAGMEQRWSEMERYETTNGTRITLSVFILFFFFFFFFLIQFIYNRT